MDFDEIFRDAARYKKQSMTFGIKQNND